MPDVPGLSLHDILAQILTFADSEFDIPYAWMQIAANAILADERLLVALTHNTREGVSVVHIDGSWAVLDIPIADIDPPLNKSATRVRVVPIEPPTNDADRP